MRQNVFIAFMVIIISSCNVEDKREIGNKIKEFYNAESVSTSISENISISSGKTKKITFHLTFRTRKTDYYDVILNGAAKIAYENFSESEKSEIDLLNITIKDNKSQYSKTFILSEFINDLNNVKVTDSIIQNICNLQLEKLNKRYSATISDSSRLSLNNIFLKDDSLYGKISNIKLIGFTDGIMTYKNIQTNTIESWYELTRKNGSSNYRIVIAAKSKEFLGLY